MLLSYLKFVDVTPLHKKGKKDVAQNSRLVNILSTLSKIYERSIFKQMSSFLEDKFPKHQCRLSKDFSMQKFILTFWKKWKNAVYIYR